MTHRRGIGLVVAVVLAAAGLVAVAAYIGSRTSDTTWDPLNYPLQQVTSGRQAADRQVVAASDGNVVIVGRLCNTATETVAAETTLGFSFIQRGVPSVPIFAGPVVQELAPGCEWHTVLADGPCVQATELPDVATELGASDRDRICAPFTNPFDAALLETVAELDGSGGDTGIQVTGVATPIEPRAGSPVPITSTVFEIDLES